MVGSDGLVWVFGRRVWVGAREVLEIPRDQCQFGQVEEGPDAEMAYLRKMERECEYSRRPCTVLMGSVVSVFLASLVVAAPAIVVVIVADAITAVAGWTR